MNANELADWCDEASQEYGNRPLVQIATMLRQQQAEIKALKAKTLTDEEIIEIWSGMETDTGEQNIIFARAILKKAQEK